MAIATAQLLGSSGHYIGQMVIGCTVKITKGHKRQLNRGNKWLASSKLAAWYSKTVRF